MCEREEADFWSIYGDFITRGVQCIADIIDEAKAIEFYQNCIAALKKVRENNPPPIILENYLIIFDLIFGHK